MKIRHCEWERTMKLSGGILSICAILAVQAASPAVKYGERLAAVLGSEVKPVAHNVWVTFTDKGHGELQKVLDPGSLVSERSLTRRMNVLSPDALVDRTDVPVFTDYVTGVEATGAMVRQRSKWFNAISVSATSGQMEAIAALPFVKELELLGAYGRRVTEEPVAPVSPSPETLQRTDGIHALDYGPSAGQVQLISVPAVHDLGNHAEGVIVGVFDNGFRLPGHEVFSSMNIIATRDFVDHKTSVVPNNPSSGFGGHGVSTLSVIGGYKPGQLIGPAFGASFILARTENDSSETPIEEDNWVAAIEWADSLGVQVTSTSLGYIDFSAPYTSWTWENMDGRTTVISRAAAMAVRKGILVVNSAGNEGYNAAHNTLGAPADADSVVAVAAVTPAGTRASFSSVGPSTSTPPHTKPDVAAQGSSVYIASPTSITGYDPGGQGTSYACPLAAGVAALLVKAAPQASPMAIVNAMKSTASNASSPNNLIGWGILNAKAALDKLILADTNVAPYVPETYALNQNYPNPFNPKTTIAFGVPFSGTNRITITVYDLLGRKVQVLADGPFSAGNHTVTFDGKGLASGVYVYKLEGNGSVLSRKMVLVK
jgi:serine protease AprX